MSGKKPKKKNPPKDGGKPKIETVERPKCDLAKSDRLLVYGDAALPPKKQPRKLVKGALRPARFRLEITVISQSDCDPAEPKRCEYKYRASVVLQQKQGGRWKPFKGAKAVIQSLKIGSPVNLTATPEKKDRTQIDVGTSLPVAPKIAKVDVTALVRVTNGPGGTESAVGSLMLVAPGDLEPSCRGNAKKK